MNRRDFIASLGMLGALSATGCAQKQAPPLPPGKFEGPNAERGHLLRTQQFPPCSETRHHEVVVIGGGVAGLSAAWRLQRGGCKDFAVYELEDSAGGNARWGENQVSAYPLGAHYLPLPPTEARAVRTLLSDLDVLQGDVDASPALYDEAFLCHAPQERLYRDGAWQEGVIPAANLDSQAQQQTKNFLDRMDSFRRARGRDGKRAFAVPMALSSRDEQYLSLDKVSMKDWMLAEGFDSAPLHWYVDYACRDDFGTHAENTSAWAGIHYFACRGDSGENSDVVLTAPEGNGWMVKRLTERLKPKLHTSAMTIRIGQLDQHSCYADIFLFAENRTVRVISPQLICAVPTFILSRIWPDAPADIVQAAAAIEHAPWLVANLTLSRMPEERRGAQIAWDNVIYQSPGLGYVVATHQNIRTRPGPTVLTYYRAFGTPDVRQSRQQLLNTSRATWAENVLDELERVHPDIRQITTRVDITRYGHAMAKPTVNSLWHANRKALARRCGGIQLAHADLSGFSIFEEANYHGVRCAENALSTLGYASRSLL